MPAFKLNRRRTLGVSVLCSALGAAALAGMPACNSILGNEDGQLATGGSSGGSTSTGGKASGGSKSSGGANSGGAAGGKAGTGGVPATGSGGSAGSGTGGGAAGSPPTTGPYCTQIVSACGGSLVGTWAFQSSCLTIPAQDPSVPPECQGGVAYQRYQLSGTITYGAATVDSTTTQNIQETIRYTTACMTALNRANGNFPPPPASASSCGTIATNQLANGASTASCPYNPAANGSCDCTLTFTNTGSAGDTYTVVGAGQYSYSSDPAGTNPTNYCVQIMPGTTTLTFSHTDDAGFTVQHILKKM
jgi:hypothetical protein